MLSQTPAAAGSYLHTSVPSSLPTGSLLAPSLAAPLLLPLLTPTLTQGSLSHLPRVTHVQKVEGQRENKFNIVFILLHTAHCWLHWKQKCGKICPKSQGSSLEKPRGVYFLLFSCNHSTNNFSGSITCQNLQRFLLTRCLQSRKNMEQNYKL